MTGAQTRAGSRSLMVLLLAGASLAACATPQPRYASRLSGAELPGGAASRPSTAQTGPRYKIGDPYQVAGIWYVPKDQPNYDETGIASWYGDAFNMQPTANGEIFDMNAISGAHTTLPLPSIVEVTNLDNGRKLRVRVNDRGPFVGGRVIDLSRAAAHELGYDQAGLARVRVRYVGPAPLDAANPPVRYASNGAPPPNRSWSTPAYPIDSRTASASAAPAGQAAGHDRATSYSTAPVAAANLPPAPVAVSSSALPPITGAAIARGGAIHDPVYATTYAPTVAPTQIAGAPGAYRVQAGAFGDRDNARRVVASLSSAGSAEIEPFERDGAMLYRVVLPGGADEGQAFALRDRVASLGYADARVLRPQ